ncbi:hypothetical protein BV22DRAFT_147034 [Leucogyrophana mollusca]|uniref:Uncharacterized protein n=1 Tax=Leucogyrophana mollusca TaxID=85980 RepID=A0ACB8BVL7_9AGAM|nr:hypothetical protein BV22DRAFT_147034 [Leucogyrophana mollusca]
MNNRYKCGMLSCERSFSTQRGLTRHRNACPHYHESLRLHVERNRRRAQESAKKKEEEARAAKKSRMVELARGGIESRPTHARGGLSAPSANASTQPCDPDPSFSGPSFPASSTNSGDIDSSSASLSVVQPDPQDKIGGV